MAKMVKMRQDVERIFRKYVKNIYIKRKKSKNFW